MAFARVMELVDMTVSKTVVRKNMRVRLPLLAPVLSPYIHIGESLSNPGETNCEAIWPPLRIRYPMFRRGEEQSFQGS